MSERPRFDARSNMIRRVSLSSGARLLYMLLDDMARDRGDWFVKQSRMATEIGFSTREVRNQITELSEAGHVRPERHGTSSTYFLAWRDRNAGSTLECSRVEQGFRSDRNAGSTLETPHLFTVLTGTPRDDERTLPECSDAEVVGWVQGWLLAYPEARRAIGKDPDEEIARACLRAVGGDAEVLARSLEWLHKVKRARPGRSWGWFPVVLGEMSRRTA